MEGLDELVSQVYVWQVRHGSAIHVYSGGISDRGRVPDDFPEDRCGSRPHGGRLRDFFPLVLPVLFPEHLQEIGGKSEIFKNMEPGEKLF